jgi:hypothetical protein
MMPDSVSPEPEVASPTLPAVLQKTAPPGDAMKVRAS